MTAPQASSATALAVVGSYRQSTQRLRDQIVAFVTAVWRSLGIYRNQQMANFGQQVIPVVTGAQQQMGSLTSAYLAALRSVQRGGGFTPTPIAPDRISGAAVRNGTTPAEVYGRPFHLVWRQLGEGAAPQQAIQAGEDRAVQSALTDLQLAKTHTSQDVIAADRHASGYRRVLEGAHSCALCIVASTQRYHKGALLPIHPACDCSIAPIYGDTDPGLVLDEDTLATAHAIVQQHFGISDSAARNPDYRTLLITHEHGELGPVLAERGKPFLGARDLNREPAA